MTKMKYNRPIHRQIDENKKDFIAIRKKALGNEPVEPAKMTFGKYAGFKLSSIPTSYLEWLITVTEDKYAIRYARELAKRPQYLKKHKL